MAFIYDTALEGRPPRSSGKLYFFRGAEFVRYDWATGRLDFGPSPIVWDWLLPPPFAMGVDAALNGEGPHNGRAFFFRGSEYVRYTWASPTYTEPSPLSDWRLPAPFVDGIDAALNGRGAKAGKAFFFRDSQWVSYDWRTARSNGPHPLSNWNLAGMFRRGVHYAVNGEGTYAKKAYFFKGAHYQRYDWTANIPDVTRKHWSNLGTGGP